jgi:tetratricopeptide (TPR) repeat protein
VGGVLAVVAAVATLVVVSTTRPRLPGQTASGSVKLSAGQQLQETLDQAESLEKSGNTSGAVALYRQVIATDPTQPDALAQLGWLEFEAGAQAGNSTVLSQAQSLEERAVRAAPSAYAPRLYLGSMLLAENDMAGAVTQYRAFLADHPPATQVDAARPFIVRAFNAEHLPVPTFPAAASATTAPLTTVPTTAASGAER